MFAPVQWVRVQFPGAEGDDSRQLRTEAEQGPPELFAPNQGDDLHLLGEFVVRMLCEHANVAIRG